MIRVEQLAKRFGGVEAVRDVSFVCPDGEITGLLGPNGAGKSTTLRMLYGVLSPDGGRALVDGIDVARDPLGARRSLGVLPHGAGIYPHYHQSTDLPQNLLRPRQLAGGILKMDAAVLAGIAVLAEPPMFANGFEGAD